MTTYDVRAAGGADLDSLAAIEDSGGLQFHALFGDAVEPVLLSPAISGEARADRPGFVLVAGNPPIGFVHVLDIEGHAHLEQLSVLPAHQGRGVGSALVRAAMTEAGALGHRELTLCTYRDVPWNGPFYRSLGFREVDDLAPYQQRLREHERRLRLDVNGIRVVMCVALRPQDPAGDLASAHD